MVGGRRKIIWTIEALLTKKELFKYWNFRNKSTLYSEKLELIFKEKLKQVAQYPEASIVISDNLRMVLIRDYYLVFNFNQQTIIVLDIWDTRQNPDNFPIK